MALCLLKFCSLAFFNRTRFSMLIGIVSILCLACAYTAQYNYYILPCPLCIYERYVFMALIAMSMLSYFKPSFIPFHFGILGAGMLLTFYHIGIEHHWWAAPASCRSFLQAAETLEELRALILDTQPIPCDKPGWIIFGFSAVTWTFFLFSSLFIGLIACFKKLSCPKD